MKTLKFLGFEFKKDTVRNSYRCDINDEYSFLILDEKHYTELFLFNNNGSYKREFYFTSVQKADDLQKWLDNNGELIIKSLNRYVNEKIKFADTIYKLKDLTSKYSILL
jgi:hypothetical protein